MELKHTSDGNTRPPMRPFNRTLWNWNLGAIGREECRSSLLIVPYGIETTYIKNIKNPKTLLIVPYGIETFAAGYACGAPPAFNRTLWNWNVAVTKTVVYHAFLLIVPYGIETAYTSTLVQKTVWLLIVPYGIETYVWREHTAADAAF